MFYGDHIGISDQTRSNLTLWAPSITLTLLAKNIFVEKFIKCNIFILYLRQHSVQQS